MEEICLKLSQADLGSVEKHTQTLCVYEEDKMVYRSVSYVPALYKIFDEILAMAAANKQSDPSMSSLRVTIDVDENLFLVSNNGSFPICMANMLIGHVNNDDNELNNFPTEPVSKTAYGTVTLEYEYKQVFRYNNMENKSDLEKWTIVSFKPDLENFNMTELENDVVALMKKRVVEMAGILGSSVTVELNKKPVPVNSFTDYVSLHLQAASKFRSDAADLPMISDKFGDRWEICVSLSDGQFQQVSFVNGVATTKGGTHVDYVSDQISNHLMAVVNKKNKNANIKADTVRKYLWVFVNCLIDNPAFDSPTKENLITCQNSFGSKCELSPEFLKKVAKSGVVDTIRHMENLKGSKKRYRVRGLKRGVDAKEAGGNNSDKCTLILTVGDVAKSFAKRGISSVGSDYYGVLALNKSLLHVSVDRYDKLYERNGQVQYIKKLLGLEDGKEYNSVESLRYGHLMIIADQLRVHDGSHYIGVLINYFLTFSPSLLRIPSFLAMSLTPTRVNGMWTSMEVKEFFSDLDNHKKEFSWEDEEDGFAIKLAFSKNIEERKYWLQKFEPGTYIDWKGKEKIKYKDFVNKELILYPIVKLQWEIPSMVDGLKPFQRKILSRCFNLGGSVKKLTVNQLCLDVVDYTSCHYELESLERSIIGLGQDFVGSNNINLLERYRGNFGSRRKGDKSDVEPWLISAKLSPITRYLFHKDDDVLLDYQSISECGDAIEPTWYMPVIPTVLVNGSEGTGTEFSTYIPNYNPRDIVANIRRLLNGQPMEPMIPWYKGFRGSIIEKSFTTTSTQEGGVSYTCSGIIEQIDRTMLRVTELPIGQWTEEYWTKLHPKFTKHKTDVDPSIENVFVHNDIGGVDLRIVLSSEEDMVKVKEEGLLQRFNLTRTISTGNMRLFDSKGVIKKYDTPEQSMFFIQMSITSASSLIEEFYNLRLALYEKRKKTLCKKLVSELELQFLDEKNLTAEKVKQVYRMIDDVIVFMKTSSRSLWIQDLDALVSQLDEQDKPDEDYTTSDDDFDDEADAEPPVASGNKRGRETEQTQAGQELVTDVLKSPEKKVRKL